MNSQSVSNAATICARTVAAGWDFQLCGDNAAMIGCQGYYEYIAGVRAGMDLNAYDTVDADNLL